MSTGSGRGARAGSDHCRDATFALALFVCLCLPLSALAGKGLPTHLDKLVVTTLKPGTGIVAKPGMKVEVLYSAWFYDPQKPDGHGRKFDGTSGHHPFAFTMDDPRLIAGWRQGMAGMRVGGCREILIPAKLAYGAKGKGIVPPAMPLAFKICLVSARKP